MSKHLIKITSILFFSIIVHSAQAASLTLQTDGAPVGGNVSVAVLYDFTDLPMFGGGFNMIYDPTTLEFVSYTRVEYNAAGFPQLVASPLGSLVSPGQYLGAGVGTFEFFTGINTAGTVGTFVFTVLSGGGDAGCGFALCLTPDLPANPMFSLAGENVTDIIFGQVPLPGAVWFMLSGLGLLAGIGRQTK